MARLTLLTKNGIIHKVGGLNWGSNKKNHTTPLDAYIPIHIGTIHANPGIFSPRRPSQTILKFTWDDNTVMPGLFEASQLNRLDGLNYPKQISSANSKRILGQYFRKRLGVSGTHLITLNDLRAYGRTHIDITKTGHNEYYLDFHV